MAISHTPQLWSNDPISRRSHQVLFSSLTDILDMSKAELDSYNDLEELNAALLCEETYTEDAEYPCINAYGEAEIGSYVQPGDDGNFDFFYVVNFDDNTMKTKYTHIDMIDQLSLTPGETYDTLSIIDLAKEWLLENEKEYIEQSLNDNIKDLEDYRRELGGRSKEFADTERGKFRYDSEDEVFRFWLDSESGTTPFDNDGLSYGEARNYVLHL